MFKTLALTMASGLALAGCNDQAASGGGGSRDQIRAVGSSTVFPFTTAVAEQFVNKNTGFKSPIVESTGTGAGFNLFCAGAGAAHPDIQNASRRMRLAEYTSCGENGVDRIMEIQIGIDGIAFAESINGPKYELTPNDLYLAIAANPNGRPNAAKTWKDVNPALPATPIQVYGPPSTSGTRDALVELILTRGCEVNPDVRAMKTTNADGYAAACSRVREDGAYVDSGENDNLIVQKLQQNPNAIGIFGYSFLDENRTTLRGIPLLGIEPTYETIAANQYPGARPLYIYVKKAHMSAIPGLTEFVGEYASAWGPGGYLAKRGLISAPEAVRTANAKIVEDGTTLSPRELN